MRNAWRILGSVVVLSALAACLGFLGYGAFALLGWSDEVVSVTERWSYRPADQPLVHALFGAVNLGLFLFVALGSVAAAFAALRAGALGVLVGGGLVAFSVALTTLAVTNPIDLDAGQRGLFCVASTIFTFFGAMMLRAWWRQPPPPPVRPA